MREKNKKKEIKMQLWFVGKCANKLKDVRIN